MISWIVDFYLGSDIQFQGTPLVKDIDYIQVQLIWISNGCNMQSWVSICFLFLQTTPTKQPTNLVLSPLYAWDFALSDFLVENYHGWHFYHLYIITKFSYTYFTQNPKILRNRDCSMLVGVGYQNILLSIRWYIQRNMTWLGRYYLFLFIIY